MGNHYYDLKGTPVFSVKAKNGNDRSTTIADCRKLGLFPSVSTILGVLDKPALLRWRYRQITDACHNEYDRVEEHYICKETYNAEMVDRAFDQVKDAADLGTKIHDALEKAFSGKKYKRDELVTEYNLMSEFVEPTLKLTLDEGMVIDKTEETIVNPSEGYAGRTDACFTMKNARGILDFKSTKTKVGVKVKGYDEQILQVSAYHVAYYGGIKEDDIGANIFLSTTEVGRVEVIWYTAYEMRRAYSAFLNICNYWFWAKTYDPRIID